MEFRHGGDMDYAPSAAGHRGADIGFKLFFNGEPGALDNYQLLLGREEGTFTSPRHRHQFDQFRLAYRGSYSVSPKSVLEEGGVGYFPEGVHYGPRDPGHASVDALVLQFGGASGQGYLSMEELAKGYESLKADGSFEGGVFRRERGEGRRNQDGFEAVWEHVTGRRISYPEGRYQGPVLMTPASFRYLPAPDQPGVSRKVLGMFSERCVRVELFRLESGAALQFPPEEAVRLGFVLSGAGVNGSEPWRRETAFRLQVAQSGVMTARDPSEIFVITLPPVSPVH